MRCRPHCTTGRRLRPIHFCDIPPSPSQWQSVRAARRPVVPRSATRRLPACLPACPTPSAAASRPPSLRAGWLRAGWGWELCVWFAGSPTPQRPSKAWMRERYHVHCNSPNKAAPDRGARKTQTRLHPLSDSGHFQQFSQIPSPTTIRMALVLSIQTCAFGSFGGAKVRNAPRTALKHA